MRIVFLIMLGLFACKKGEQETEKVKASEVEVVSDAPVGQEEQKKVQAPKETKTAKPEQAETQAQVSEQMVEKKEVPQPPKPRLPDVRLLLTVADVQDIAKGKIEFERKTLEGFVTDARKDAVYFEPRGSQDFGVALQVFAFESAQACAQEFDRLFSSYPNSVDIKPVAGKTFFAYWGEVMHVGFVSGQGTLIGVVSCGRKFCTSDDIYALAGKVANRMK
jgi:hypothetical protein